MIKNIVLEIGTEEIPSRFIPDALENLKKNAEASLKNNRIEFKDTKAFATPRRLVLIITNASDTQSEEVQEFKGPPLKNSYDENGEPTKAAIGFAKGKGIEVNDLTEIEVNGVKYIAAKIIKESKNTIDVLPEILVDLIASLTFPKSMYWESNGVRFARPIRWILALADEKVIQPIY